MLRAFVEATHDAALAGREAILGWLEEAWRTQRAAWIRWEHGSHRLDRMHRPGRPHWTAGSHGPNAADGDWRGWE